MIRRRAQPKARRGAARRRPPARRRAAKARAGPRKRRSGPPPSYFSLLQEAVLTLKERKGASLPAIRRELEDKYGSRFDAASNKLLTSALQRLSNRGTVIQKKGYKYRLNAPKVRRQLAAAAAAAAVSSSKGATVDQSGKGKEAAKSGSTSYTSGSSRPSRHHSAKGSRR